MKKLLAILTISASVVTGYSQGTINIGTFFGTAAESKKVTKADGTLAEGADWYVQAYAGPVGTAVDALVAATQAPLSGLRTGNNAGLIVNNTRTFTGITPPGSPVTVAIRVWSKSLGATWEEAMARVAIGAPAGAEWGECTPFTVDSGDPTSVPPGTPTSIAAMFTGVQLVPEPSTIALGALGGLGMLALIRRRK